MVIEFDRKAIHQTMTNQEIIDKFFEGYTKKDFNIIRTVMTEDVVWTFPGQHKLAGVKKGIDQLVAFFDTMSGIMSKSRPTVEKLVVASKGNYLIECQHIKTNRDDGINIDHHVCVLWTFENGKIISGRHFFSNPPLADNYFTAASK
ncbi:MAG TPA: nuclear transport factor 2 family protein [Cyclobacteriaceae bacterium]|jgi:ketosteroid isomerase-like protein|nr:nuclear transport factor 2 family protein [Cyclobacteriaceae bacterium]